MLIKCDKCNFENQMGAIFCRDCGEKLNIEDIRPVVTKNRPQINVFKLVRTCVGLVLLVILIWIFVGIFSTPSMPEMELDDKGKQVAISRCNRLIKRVESKLVKRVKPKKFVFTADETTHCFNNLFIQKQEESEEATYSMEKLVFDIADNGDVTLFLQTKLAGKFDAIFHISGAPVDPEDDKGRVIFKVENVKMGTMSIPNFMKKSIIKKFVPATEFAIVAKIISKIISIEVDPAAGTFIVIVK